jgi:signal peptidase I
MAPGIREGDWLRVKPIGVDGPPRPGEVVVRIAGERLVAHRLVEIRDGSAVTRGDACRASDSAVPAESLLGRVVEVKREPAVRRFWRRVRRAVERRWREE